MKKKYTTEALEKDEHLIKTKSLLTEVYCVGFKNAKRYLELDGFYYKKELKLKQPY